MRKAMRIYSKPDKFGHDRTIIFILFFLASGKNPWWTPLHPRHGPNQDERGLRGNAGLGAAPCCADNIPAKKPISYTALSGGHQDLDP